MTRGRGVEAAFDGIGATARTTRKAVRSGGTLVWFGMITFLDDGRRDLRKMVKTAGTLIPAFAPNLIPRGKRTKLYSIQDLAKKHPDWYKADLTTLLGMLADGKITPEIAAVWGLDEVPAAVQGLAHGAMPGKQVIAITSGHR